MLYTTLDDPSDPTYTELFGINNSGQIVGDDGAGNSAGYGGFLYSGGTYTTILGPNGTGAVALGINNIGEIVGYYGETVGGGFLRPYAFENAGFLYDGGSYTSLSYYDGYSIGGSVVDATNLLCGINDAGQITGSGSTSGSPPALKGSFLYSGGFPTTINDPNSDFSSVNFIGNTTVANGINNAGDIVGYFQDSSGVVHGFLYNGTTYTTLDDPYASGSTEALGINNNGEIVGIFTDSSGRVDGFLYNINTGAWTTLDDPLGINGTYVEGINDSGQIVGYYVDSSGNTDGFISSVNDLQSSVWTTGVSGNFATATNWNTDAVPASADDVAITASGTYTVTSLANETVDSLTTAAGATLLISAGTFTSAGGVGSVNSGTVVVGVGATFELGGFLINNGTFEAIGGNIILDGGVSGSGPVTVGGGGSVSATGNNYVFDGLGGSELMEGTGNLNEAFSDNGSAQLYFVGNENQLFGGTATDWLGVTGSNNALVSGAGNDFVGATGNSNTLAGGSGNPTLFADGTGNYLYAGSGQDWEGVSGNQNQIFGGSGADWMGATGDNNAIAAGAGNSTLDANGNSNTLSGSGGGNDWIGVSGKGNYLYGGAGNDYIAATGSSDVLNPNGAGTDTLVAGAHSNDQFVYHPGDGNVTIDNFSPSSGDVIDFAGWGVTSVSQLGPYVSTSSDGSIVLNLGGNAHLTLEGIPGGLQNSWFNFHA